MTDTADFEARNFAAMDIKPGSMGRPLPGVAAGLLERGDDGRARVTGGKGHGGHQARRRG